MTMITPSYLGETIEYSSLHACRSTLEDPTQQVAPPAAATGPALMVEGSNGSPQHSFPLDHLPIVIGRRTGCDVRLLDTKVSREHARIRRDGAILLVEDLQSLNGTQLNGRDLAGEQPLQDGDELQIGRIRLRYRAGGTPRG